MNPWTESEVRGAVEDYFRLLISEQNGEPQSKVEIYRSLASRFPNRSAKAFERKFQNISAVLYEQHLPYCSGLKPLGNYQRLLKLVVLDHIDRTPLPALEPHEILVAKLRELAKKKIQVEGRGTGRYGLAIEKALGIPQNSSKAPDFMGIELKTKSDKSLQTLFSRTPSRYIAGADKKEVFERYSYQDDKRDRRALYTSFSSTPDSLGFSLIVSEMMS